MNGLEIRKLAAGIIFLAIVSTLSVGCSRGGSDAENSADDISIELNVTPDPPQVGPAVIDVTLLDADGEPIDDADLKIEGNMSHAGMEPVNAYIAGGSEGHYISKDFEFTMGGDWVITVTGTTSDGREFRRTFDLNGVST